MFDNFSIFCHFNNLCSILWDFDILHSIFCPFDILCFRSFAFDILPLRYFVFDILRGRYFVIRYYAIRYFAFSIFCDFDILRLDILRLRYSAISISCDFDILLSIFCVRYFAIPYFVFRYFFPEPIGKCVKRGIRKLFDSIRSKLLATRVTGYQFRFPTYSSHKKRNAWSSPTSLFPCLRWNNRRLPADSTDNHP